MRINSVQGATIKTHFSDEVTNTLDKEHRLKQLQKLKKG